MPDFKKNNRFSGGSRPSFNRPNGGGFGGSRDSRGGGHGGNRDFGPKEMFDAECSKCHGVAQVPFRPNGKKPVFCAKCFEKDGDRDGGYSQPKREFNAPRSNHYDAPAPSGADRQVTELKSQIERMNATLEKLVTAVDTFNRATALTKEIRKHFPADKPAAAPAKKAAKVESKPVAKKAVAKKPTKAAKSGKK
jgi:CxxC-x17-CxxC domain-containing protein